MPPRKPAEVIDDWETEDYDEGRPVMLTPAQQAANNARLWNETSYTILPSSSTSATAPPPVVTQPKLQILKRPSSAASSNDRADNKTPPPKTLVERERSYQEARERIFAKDKEKATEAMRSPAGPPSGEEAQREMGFGRRRDPTKA